MKIKRIICAFLSVQMILSGAEFTSIQKEEPNGVYADPKTAAART